MKRNDSKKTNNSRVFGIRKDNDGVMFTAFYPDAQSVQVAGDFNGWQADKNPMKRYRKEGVWKVKIPLKKGTYRYRFVIDGQWQHDPYNDATEQNPYNELNSLVNM